MGRDGIGVKPGDLLIVSIDMSRDVMKQLSHIAEENSLFAGEVVCAWCSRQQFNGTSPSYEDVLPNLHFDIRKIEVKPEFDEKEIKVQHSFKAVKERNRFFDRKHQ
jgi:hypothetical protein